MVEKASDNSADLHEIRRLAMDALARREYARAELHSKLTRKGFESSAVEQIIQQLCHNDLLSDWRFVESYLRSHIPKGQGPVKLRHELRQRKINEILIDQGFAEINEDWLQLATQVLRKRFGEGAPESIKEKAKQMRFLTYRGFTSEQIRAALETHAN